MLNYSTTYCYRLDFLIFAAKKLTLALRRNIIKEMLYGGLLMFFKQPDLIFSIKDAASFDTPSCFLPVQKNVERKTPHEMTLSVNGDCVNMTVDDIAASSSDFKLNSPADGYISLVSNAYDYTEGAFRYLYIFQNGRKVFDIDFSGISSADELEQWFDCYYFEILDGSKGKKSRISDFWRIDKGRLRCIKEKKSEHDLTEFCLLTYTLRSFGDFQAVLGFEQCGFRYGLSFGCRIAKFPFYRDPKTMTIKATQGGFAYVEQEGYRNLRGDISREYCSNKDFFVQSYKSPLPNFYAEDESLTFSFNTHTLIFHIKSDAVYKFQNKKINIKSGSITYIPPNMPFERIYSTDKYIAVFFDIINGQNFQPENFVPANPAEYEFQFERILKTFKISNDISRYECTYIFYKIYTLISKETQMHYRMTNTEQAKNYPKLLRPALEYLDSNFSDPNIRIPALAQMCNIGETYFRKQFTHEMGISPQDYIQKMRIDFSIFLLDSNYYKIYEVAEKSGFSNPKYFSTVFKSIMKLSPTEWMKSKNQGSVQPPDAP